MQPENGLSQQRQYEVRFLSITGGNFASIEVTGEFLRLFALRRTLCWTVEMPAFNKISRLT